MLGKAIRLERLINRESGRTVIVPMDHGVTVGPIKGITNMRDMVDAMDYAMYHLDGAAAIRHLDALQEIPRLRAIQWVPGPGQEAIAQWYPLIARILNAGRSVEVFCRADEIDDLVRHVGARGLLIAVSVSSPAEAEALMDRYWR